MTEQDPILEKAKELRKAGASVEQVKQYLQSKGYDVGEPAKQSLRLDIPKPPEAAPAESTRGLSRSRPGASGDFQAMTSPGQARALMDDVLPALAATALNTAQGIPGMERLEAAAGSAGSKLTDHPMSYKESLQTLRGETEKIPSDLRATQKLIGSAPLAAVKPLQALSPAKGGALIGAADQALSADEMGAGERAVRTLAGGAAGAAVGKTLDAAIGGVRGLAAKTPGQNALDREASMGAADAQSYGKAAQEGAAAGGTSPAIQSALGHPAVKPFADKVRKLQQFQQASDAEILAETYKQMGEYERRLGTSIANATEFLPTKAAQEQHIGLGKKELMKAADPSMPSFRPAVQQHARAESELDALGTGVDAARRAMRNAKTPPQKLDTKSPEAIRALIQGMAPAERKAAEQGILGELGESFNPRLDPSITTGFGLTKGFGVFPYAADAGRANALLRKTGSPTQKQIDAAIRALLFSGQASTP